MRELYCCIGNLTQISFGYTKTNKKARNSLTIIIDNDCLFSCFMLSGVLPDAAVIFSSVGAAVISSVTT